MIKGHAQKRLMSILVVGKKSKQFCFESVEQHKHKNRWPFEVFGRDDCNKWFSCASYNFHSTTIWYQSHKRQRAGSWPFPRHNSCHQIIMEWRLIITLRNFLFMFDFTLKRSVWELLPAGILFVPMYHYYMKFGCARTTTTWTIRTQETFSQIRRIVPNLDYYVALSCH